MRVKWFYLPIPIPGLFLKIIKPIQLPFLFALTLANKYMRYYWTHRPDSSRKRRALKHCTKYSSLIGNWKLWLDELREI